MIYAINKRTKEHQIPKDQSDFLSGENLVGTPSGDTWCFVRADAEGWIPWKGESDDGPLAEASLCELKLSCGTKVKRQAAGEWSWSRGGDQHIIAYRPILDAKAEAPEWDGGLPPVGVECEVMYCEEWKRCEIIAHFKQRVGMVAAFTVSLGDGSKALDAYVADCFRPIRSEEDLAVEEMCRIAEGDTPGFPTVKTIMQRLYRAGLRFPSGA